MLSPTILDNLAHVIDNIDFDIKVEVLVAELIKTYPALKNQLILKNKGQFTRNYRRDILKTSTDSFANTLLPFLMIELSRDGIYDMLPEGLFHYPKSSEVRQDVGEMTKEYKRKKKEEEEARQFFIPFENEFLINAIEREQLENEMLFELANPQAPDFLYSFWNIPTDLPTYLTSKLIKLLPYADQIVGDLELTCTCLSYILEEEVSYQRIGYKELSESEQFSTLGNHLLGLDLILGNSYMDYSLYVEFKIGPIQNSDSLAYFQEGKLKKFISLFYEYFLPLEINTKTTILLNPEEEYFSISNPRTLLGITTKL